MSESKQSLYHKFQYHPLDQKEQRERVEKIYKASWSFVESILDTIPECSNRTLSIQKAKEALLFAIEGLRESESKI